MVEPKYVQILTAVVMMTAFQLAYSTGNKYFLYK